MEGDVMEKKSDCILLLALSLVAALGAGCQNSGGLAIAGKAGTLGLGGELTTAVASDINARIGFNAVDLSFEAEAADIDYDYRLDFHSYSALVDWFVINSPFRITGGIISVDHQVDLRTRGAAGEQQEIGDGSYDWANVGTLSGEAEVDCIAPYIGIGWGNILDKNRRWGFYGDAGIAFTQSPDVTLSATGAAPGLAADLERERKDIEDDLEHYKFYPVLSAGLFFRF